MKGIALILVIASGFDCTAEPAFDPDSPRDCGISHDCRSSEVCLNGYGCYPRNGWAGKTCGRAEPIDVELAIPGLGSEARVSELAFTGDVTAVTAGTSSLTAQSLTVVHDNEASTITYDIGPYFLPVVVGERIQVFARRVHDFGSATGLKILDSNGDLIALMDDGHWGSAWDPGTDQMSGFSIDTEILGCAIAKSYCYDYAPLGMRFSFSGGATVLALPGDDALLTADGTAYTAVNAFAEQIANVECTDVAPRRAWAIIRVEAD